MIKDKLNKTFLQHWEYNREDPHLQNFLNDTSMYSQSNDLLNNSSSDVGLTTLVNS